jgi:hypothetical protein
MNKIFVQEHPPPHWPELSWIASTIARDTCLIYEYHENQGARIDR